MQQQGQFKRQFRNKQHRVRKEYMSKIQSDSRLFEVAFETAQVAMANNTPDSRWKKVQLSKVMIKKFDPMTSGIIEIAVAGDPTTERDLCIIDCWTPLETAFFERENKYHILKGNIVPFNKPIEIKTSENTLTDEQIIEVLEKRFMALKHLLEKLDSAVTVKRILNIAEELNKPIATINAIKARLSELQELEYQITGS